jgi:hypothetical protein
MQQLADKCSSIFGLSDKFLEFGYIFVAMHLKEKVFSDKLIG